MSIHVNQWNWSAREYDATVHSRCVVGRGGRLRGHACRIDDLEGHSIDVGSMMADRGPRFSGAWVEDFWPVDAFEAW